MNRRVRGGPRSAARAENAYFIHYPIKTFVDKFLITKKSIRQKIRAQRRQLTAIQRQSAGLEVLRQLRRLPGFLTCKKIGAYIANDGELPLDYVVDFFWERKKNSYLPALFGKNTRLMHFGHFSKNSQFTLNRYGIPEPSSHIRRQLKPQQLDLVLLPLVAFDANGNRLGMGGGFYDKTFAYLRRRTNWRKPKLIGIAYDFQEAEHLPSEPWDVPLDYIVTQSRIIKPNIRS